MVKSRKVLSVLLAVLMLLSIAPVSDMGIEASAVSYVSVNGHTVVDSITFNGATTQAVYTAYYGSGYNSDTTYCCAAFVKRFYANSYGIDVWNLTYQQTPTTNNGSFSVTTSPKVGDIVRRNSKTHWMIVKAVNGSTVTLIEQNWWTSPYSQAPVNRTISTSNSDYTFFRYSKATDGGSQDSGSTSGNNPVGSIDHLSGGAGVVNISGWAFDADDTSAQLNIHVYIGDEGHGWITANKERTDVNNVHGCGNYHGFSETIQTAKSGNQTIEIYAINVGSGANVLLHRETVYITPDTESPKLSNIAYRNSDTGFLVTCGFSDNIGVTKVVVPVWTEYNGQDDLIFYEANINYEEDYAWFSLDKISHNNETGIYKFDVYAYDATGNYDMQGTFSTYVGNLVQFWWLSNPDNSESYIDTSGTPTVTGERKFWFKEWDDDSNYYLDIFIDGTKVVANSPSDENGYISYIIDTGTMEDGLHNITCVLADTQTSYTASKDFYVNNLVRFHGISTADNTQWFDASGTPTVSGERKFWFKKESTDTNYYFDLYIDGKKMEGNKATDTDGWYSYTVNTASLGNGNHTIRAELFDSSNYYTATKTFNVNNPSYTITFNANGGSCSTGNKSVTYGSTYGTLPTPTRSGYNFDGWYTAASGGTKVSSSTKVTATGNHTLYAHWTCKHGTTEIKNAKSATCTAEGYTGDTYCKTCGVKTKSGTAIAKLAHNSNTTIPAVAATCTKTGLTEGKKCSVCGTVTVAQQTVAKTAHSYTSKVTTVATCKAEGVKTYTCSACSASYTEKIAKNASNHIGGTEVKNAKAATCTAEGYTGDTYCKGCGVKTKSGSAIAKTAHTYTVEVIKAPTCIEKGMNYYTCACGSSYTQYTDETEHTYGSDGTCTECGAYNKSYDKESSSSSDNCTCNCHKTGFAGLIWKILNFFYKLFKINPICDCGSAHY